MINLHLAKDRRIDMLLFTVIPLSWMAATAFVVAACQAASRADASVADRHGPATGEALVADAG